MSLNTELSMSEVIAENLTLKRVLEATREKLANSYISTIDLETLLNIEREKVAELTDVIEKQAKASTAKNN